MKFICNTECFSNILGRGFHFEETYDLNTEETGKMIGALKKPGHFPRRFDPADEQARKYYAEIMMRIEAERIEAERIEAEAEESAKTPKTPKTPKKTEEKNAEE